MPDWTDATIDHYATTYGDHPSVFAVVDEIPFVGGESVLDIGCGTGSALRAMAERTGGDLVGIDPYDRMLDHARRSTRLDRVSFAVAGAEALPFDAARFDIVTAINSVPHWTDADAGYREVLRVLRPGGLFVIGGERFTEPKRLRGRPYMQTLREDGFAVDRRDLDASCFVVLAGKERRGT